VKSNALHDDPGTCLTHPLAEQLAK